MPALKVELAAQAYDTNYWTMLALHEHDLHLAVPRVAHFFEGTRGAEAPIDFY